jgi:hypothetical protein
MEVDQELTNTQPIKSSVNEIEPFTDYHLKNKPFLSFDADSFIQPPTLVEADSTNSSIFSAGNATLATHECFEIEVEEPHYNYHGPKIVLPKYECPVSIYMADSIGAVKSRTLLQVLLDSGSMVSMIKRSALPQNVITKSIGETKNITNLAGRVQEQEVVIPQRFEVA